MGHLQNNIKSKSQKPVGGSVDFETCIVVQANLMQSVPTRNQIALNDLSVKNGLTRNNQTVILKNIIKFTINYFLNKDLVIVNKHFYLNLHVHILIKLCIFW